MHIDFALPVAGDLAEGYKEWQRKAERSVMDYSFPHGSDHLERQGSGLRKAITASSQSATFSLL